MPVLSYSEGALLEAVRKLENKFPEGVPSDSARYRALHYEQVSYDQAYRALRGLVEKGLLEKPKRGYYRLPENRRETR